MNASASQPQPSAAPQWSNLSYTGKLAQTQSLVAQQAHDVRLAPFLDAARVSLEQQNKLATDPSKGAFAAGYGHEAIETARLATSNRWNLLAAQPTLAFPQATTQSGTRIPDLILESAHDASTHIVDIKAGRNLAESVDQLKELSNVKQLRFGAGPERDVASLTVVTGVGSAEVDMHSLTQVALYANDAATRRQNALRRLENRVRREQGQTPLPDLPLANRLPLRVRSNSMDEGTSLTFGQFLERRKQRLAPMATTAAGSAAAGPGSFPALGGSAHGGGAGKSFPPIK